MPSQCSAAIDVAFDYYCFAYHYDFFFSSCYYALIFFSRRFAIFAAAVVGHKAFSAITFRQNVY